MFNRFIQAPNDLVTTHEQTRAGFLSIALEKNVVSDPYVKNALAFKAMVQGVCSPDDLLTMRRIRPFLLTAAGLSDKATNYLTYEDETAAIEELIDKFLKPAGENFIDEAIYRYLLIKGDAVGGIMRNRIGAMGQEKLIRSILSCMNVGGIYYNWLDENSGKWYGKCAGDINIEKSMKALHWNSGNGSRLLIFNKTLKTVRKNVDICLFEGNTTSVDRLDKTRELNTAIMLGELKGGIDPAGADEHWKTGNTALERIRTCFEMSGRTVQTSFVAAAIANAMAVEIFEQLESGKLSNAANLTDVNQLTEYCNWLIQL